MDEQEKDRIREEFEASRSKGAERQQAQQAQAPQQEGPAEGCVIKNVIGVVSGKGGVGKSLVTGILARELSRRGAKVGILDADVTGPSIPKMFGMSGCHAYAQDNLLVPLETKGGIKVMSANLVLENEDDPVLWRGPVVAGAIKQFWGQCAWGELDYLLVDMPPGTSDVALTVFQSLPVEGVVIVSSPQDLVQMVVGKAVKMANMMDVPVLGLRRTWPTSPVPTATSPYGPSRLQETADHFDLVALGQLPIDPALAAACDAGSFEQSVPDGLLPEAVQTVIRWPSSPRRSPEGTPRRMAARTRAKKPSRAELRERALAAASAVGVPKACDVAVVGGGASGLVAAITAAEAGARTCVLEQDLECGRKVLATGNGRCNFANEGP